MVYPASSTLGAEADARHSKKHTSIPLLMMSPYVSVSYDVVDLTLLYKVGL